jgi:hydroxymethylbilane synthase
MDDIIKESEIITWEDMLPAVAQGAIGIQCRSEDTQMLKYLAALNHPDTKTCVDCERAFLAELDGNCRTPIAGQAKIVVGKLLFKGLISKPDGTEMIRVEQNGAPGDAIAIGTAAGKEVKKIAGDKFHEYGEAAQAAQDNSNAAAGQAPASASA